MDKEKIEHLLRVIKAIAGLKSFKNLANVLNVQFLKNRILTRCCGSGCCIGSCASIRSCCCIGSCAW